MTSRLPDYIARQISYALRGETFKVNENYLVAFRSREDGPVNSEVYFQPITTSAWGRNRMFYDALPFEIGVTVIRDGNVVNIGLAHTQHFRELFFAAVSVPMAASLIHEYEEGKSRCWLTLRLNDSFAIDVSASVDRFHFRNAHGGIPECMSAFVSALSGAMNHTLPADRGAELWIEKLAPVFREWLTNRDAANPLPAWAQNRRSNPHDPHALLIPAAYCVAPNGVEYHRPTRRPSSGNLDRPTPRASVPALDQPSPVPGPSRRVTGPIKRKML